MPLPARRTARLIIADSESCADLYWATRFFVPDPIIYLEHRGRKILAASDLEYGRARKEAAVDEVLPISRYGQYGRHRRYRGLKDPLVAILKERRIRRLLVPSYFPLRQAERLRQNGIRVTSGPDPFFPDRAVKSPDEKRKIVKSLRATEGAIALAIETLRRARVRKNRLFLGGSPLTSERLRRVIEVKLMEQGFVARHTIVAGGRQSADPHGIGTGPLYAHQPIVIDVFPRSSETGYHGDITRTVVKGSAPEALRKMYRAVRRAQENGIRAIRHGVDAAKVHATVADTLEKLGFRTEQVRGRPQGFIHSTGHGLGLEIHEPPRVSRLPAILKKGNVVTVEPGLYYETLGGIRIEDVVFVTKRGCEVLTRLPKRLEIP